MGGLPDNDVKEKELSVAAATQVEFRLEVLNERALEEASAKANQYTNLKGKSLEELSLFTSKGGSPVGSDEVLFASEGGLSTHKEGGEQNALQVNSISSYKGLYLSGPVKEVEVSQRLPFATAPIIEQVSAKILESKEGIVKIGLSPVELGAIKIEISHEENPIIRIWSERSVTKDLLQENISLLLYELADGGVLDADIHFEGGNEWWRGSHDSSAEYDSDLRSSKDEDDLQSFTLSDEERRYIYIENGALDLRF